MALHVQTDEEFAAQLAHIQQEIALRGDVHEIHPDVLPPVEKPKASSKAAK